LPTALSPSCAFTKVGNFWTQLAHLIRIDNVTYEHDVVIDRGDVRKRKKQPSKKFRAEFGHSPVSADEKIPWQSRRSIKCCL